MGIPWLFKMNITDLMTENGCKGHEGEPQSMLVFGLCKTCTAQAQVKAGLCVMPKLQVIIIFLSKLHGCTMFIQDKYN